MKRYKNSTENVQSIFPISNKYKLIIFKKMNFVIFCYFILSSYGSFIRQPILRPIRIEIQGEPIQMMDTEPMESSSLSALDESIIIDNDELSRIKRYAVSAWRSERSKKMDKVAFRNLIKLMRQRTRRAI